MGERTFTEVPGTSAEDFDVIDPAGFTQQGFQGIQNLQNVGQTGLGLNADPFASFIGQTPQMQNLIQGSSSPLQQMLMDQTRQFTEQAVQDVGQEFSGLGSLYSGAARDAAGQRATQAAGQAATQLGQQQLGMLGNLFSQGFQNQQRQQDLYANLLAQSAGLGAQFGGPSYTSQQYMANPTFGETVGQVVGAVAPFAGAALGVPLGGGGASALGTGRDFDMSQHRPSAPISPPNYSSPYSGGFRPSGRL